MATRPWQRVRFVSAELRSDTAGSLHGRVQLELRGGRSISGTARCTVTGATDLRCAALATVEAVCVGVGVPENDIELLGVKSIEAFDATVVVVALSVRVGEEKRRLVGAYLAEGDLVKGAAIAVLNAMNRYLESSAFTE